MEKDLSTPIMDAVRERDREFWAKIDSMPKLQWWTIQYWITKYYFWRL